MHIGRWPASVASCTQEEAEGGFRARIEDKLAVEGGRRWYGIVLSLGEWVDVFAGTSWGNNMHVGRMASSKSDHPESVHVRIGEQVSIGEGPRNVRPLSA